MAPRLWVSSSILTAACVLGLSMGGCARATQDAPPVPSPGPSPVPSPGAPALRAPADGASISAFTALVLTVEDVAGAYTQTPTGYDVEIASGGVVMATLKLPRTGNTSSTTVTARLAGHTPLSWRARAVFADSSAGEWSETRTFELRASAFVDPPPYGDHGDNPIDRGRGSVLLRAGIQMQGQEYDCTDTAQWRVETPELATVSPTGVLAPMRSGEAVVGVRCDGADGRGFLEIADEVWTGSFAIESCELVGGTGPPCVTPELSVGLRLPVTILIHRRTAERPLEGSRITLFRQLTPQVSAIATIPIDHTTAFVAASGTVGLDGEWRIARSCTADRPDQDVRVHGVHDRLEIDWHRRGNPCFPDQPIVAAWSLKGPLIDLQR